MRKLVSIIVPVYNVEKYLDTCVSSIVKQSYVNIEIILVDDGSTDSSSILCDTWKKKDNRIIVIHKSNGGQSEARNVGLLNASGEFVIFIDSDDYISSDHVEELVTAITNTKSDIVCARAQAFFDNKSSRVEKKEKRNSSSFDGNMAIKKMLYEQGVSSSLWVKIYKRALFESIGFPVGRIYEDLFTVYKLFYRCKKVTIIDKTIYYYRIRIDSTIGKFDSRKNNDLLIASKEIYEFVNKNIPNVISAAEYKLFFSAIELFVHYPTQGIDANDYGKIEELWTIIKKYRLQVLFDNNGKAKYRIFAMVSFMGRNALRRFYSIVTTR